MKKILIPLITLFLLNGCWNYQELNDYAIVTGMAVDYDKKEQEYKISLLIANGSKSEEETAQITILSGEGKNIYESYKNISLSSPKELYINHLSVVIFSEEMAEKGLNNIIDFLMREPQSNQNFYIITAKDSSAKDVLSILTPLADYPSQDITSNIKVTEKLQGRITDANFNHFVSKILQKGINPVINSIIIEGDPEKGTKKEDQQNSIMKASTKLDTIGIFKNDRLVDWANQEESIGINILLNDISILYLTIPCQDGNTVLSSESFDVKHDINKNRVKTTINIKGKIDETTCKINLRDEKELQKLEQKAEIELENYMQQAINLAKRNETDIFGYGTMLYKKDYKAFKQIKDWDKYFKDFNIKLDAHFKINEKGALEQAIGDYKI